MSFGGARVESGREATRMGVWEGIFRTIYSNARLLEVNNEEQNRFVVGNRLTLFELNGQAAISLATR
jgi:hypothetical protein